MDWNKQHPGAPLTPSSSVSSQSAEHFNPQKTDKVPTLKQLPPGPVIATMSKLSNEDLEKKGKEDLLNLLRGVESDYKAMLGEHGNVIKDVNRRYQIFILELRNLKEVNQTLQDDNQELCDLCCFLDDDRQRGRKLAREWQRFGRYTASVMRSEVAVYQEKLRELENRQSELVGENMELKELCLFLDQERSMNTNDRDEGDGSSNGTIGQEDATIVNEANVPPDLSNVRVNTGSTNYLRDLEQKVQKLEEEKVLLTQLMDSSKVPAKLKQWDSNKPDAVSHAMKVLQVHEEIEKSPVQNEEWNDSEKAILREMCNVVWRKLGDESEVGSFNESSDSVLGPPPNAFHSDVTSGARDKILPISAQQPPPTSAAPKMTTDVQHINLSNNSVTKKSEPSSSDLSTSNAFHQSYPQRQYHVQSKRAALPQTDQRVDTFPSESKSQYVADKTRPQSPMKKPDVYYGSPEKFDVKDSYDHHAANQQSRRQDYPSHSTPTKHFLYSEDEKLPPHFLSHRAQQALHNTNTNTVSQPLTFSGVNTKSQPSMQYSNSQHGLQNNPPQDHRPLYHSYQDMPQNLPHSKPQDRYFVSTSGTNPQYDNEVKNSQQSYVSSSNSTSRYPPPASTSHQYPHRPVRLLDAPIMHQVDSRQEQRMMRMKDENSYPQQSPKPIPHSHHQPLRRDMAAGIPNEINPGRGNTSRNHSENVYKGPVRTRTDSVPGHPVDRHQRYNAPEYHQEPLLHSQIPPSHHPDPNSTHPHYPAGSVAPGGYASSSSYQAAGSQYAPVRALYSSAKSSQPLQTDAGNRNIQPHARKTSHNDRYGGYSATGL